MMISYSFTQKPFFKCYFSFQSCFQFSLVWSIGASCDGSSRTKFDHFVKELFSGKDEAHPVPSVVGKIEHAMPTEHTVYDFMFEVCLVEFLSI